MAAQAALKETKANLRVAIRANVDALINAETEKRAEAKRTVTQSTRNIKNLGKKKARLLKAVTSYSSDTTTIAELARAPALAAEADPVPDVEGAAAANAGGGAAIAAPGPGAEGGAAIAAPVLDAEGGDASAAPVLDAPHPHRDADAEEEGDQ